MPTETGVFAAGTSDITPERPVPLAGFRDRRGVFAGVNDPLELNALVCRGPAGLVALVSADLLFVTRELKSRVLERLSGRGAPSGDPCGLSEERFVLAATHTHSAPAVDSGKPMLGRADEGYVELVVERAAALLGRLADAARRPGTVGYASGMADHSVNRRRPGWEVNRRSLPHRTILAAPNPQGPRDETIHVVLLADDGGRVGCVLWSYACHPVGFPALDRVSADYPGVVRARLRARFGADLPAIYLPGFAGDVRPRSVEGPRPFRQRLREIVSGPLFVQFPAGAYSAWASTLAERVVDIASGAMPGRPLRAVACTASLPLARILVDARPDQTVTFQRLSLAADLHFAAVSAEPVAGQAALLAGLWDGVVIPVGCIDTVFGYLPTGRMLAEGGYEVEDFREPFGVRSAFRAELDHEVRAGWEQLTRAAP